MIRSGFSSQRGMQQSGRPEVGSGGTGCEISMPGSRIGRATPSSTVKISPNSFVGATDTSVSACMRMPSNRSSWSGVPAGLRIVIVRTIGAGNGLPLDEIVTLLAELEICVRLKNSVAVPVTVTASPTATPGVPATKTKIPSDVSGSRSTEASGSCMKKPFDLRAVTIPELITLSPANGEVAPSPWIWLILARTAGGGQLFAPSGVAVRATYVIVLRAPPSPFGQRPIESTSDAVPLDSSTCG